MKHRGPIAGIATYGPYVATAGYDNQFILWEQAGKYALARSQHGVPKSTPRRSCTVVRVIYQKPAMNMTGFL